jgi:hypothetical protein
LELAIRTKIPTLLITLINLLLLRLFKLLGLLVSLRILRIKNRFRLIYLRRGINYRFLRNWSINKRRRTSPRTYPIPTRSHKLKPPHFNLKIIL